MKRKILMTIIVFLFPIVVDASSLSLDCGNDIATGNTLTCIISGNSNKKITAISAKIRTSNGINFSSFTKTSEWYGDGEEGNIDLLTSNDLNNTFGIGTVSFNTNNLSDGGTGTININDIYFYDEAGREETLSSITKNIRIASTNNNLANLSISSGSLNPSFNSNITSYSTTLNAANISITARAENSNAKISGDIGSKKLSYGNNTFRINVTSESGSTKTYTINIIRPNDKPNNNNGNTSGGNTNTNTTNNKSSNNYLKTITIDDISMQFEKEVLDYNVTVPYEKEKIDIEALPEDDKSKVEILNIDKLEIGDNKIEIKVTAEDNTSRTYTINVIRKEEGSKLSSNNNISNLIIKNHDIDFNSNILDYKINIKNEKKLDINVILEDNTSIYKIVGNNNLKNNSKIKIIVTSEDNNFKTYTITVKKNDSIIKIIFLLIIIILLSINILRLVLRGKYERKDKRI